MELVKDNELCGYLLEIKGGHLAGGVEALEKQGIVTIVEKKLLSNNCCEYKLQNNFSNEFFFKTEFPVYWSEENILENGWKIFEFGMEIPAYKGKYSKKLIIDNVEMSIVFKNKIIEKTGINTSYIVTILPYI